MSGKKKKISHPSGDNLSELIVIASRDCITVLSQARIILMGECYFIFLLVVIFGNSVFPVIDLKPSDNSGISPFSRQERFTLMRSQISGPCCDLDIKPDQCK